jgi:hypothetical protein
MSLALHSIENVKTPQTLAISNAFALSSNKQDGCNPSGDTNNFGNYFQSCSLDQTQAYWGSQKPAPDRCSAGLKGHEGVPCNSLWNNLTKRKSVVEYKR